jgi:hypothetical protein
MATLNGKKFLDQHGLNYVWQKIDNKYAHVVGATGNTTGATITDGNVVIGKGGGRGITDSGYSIGAAIKTDTNSGTRALTEFGTNGTTIATEENVVTYVSNAVGSLGDVIELKGLASKDTYKYFPWTSDKKTAQLTNLTLTNGTVVNPPANGDLVIYDGEEWVWIQTSETEGAWHEIGVVKDDEAIKSVSGSGVIAVTEPTTGDLVVNLNAIGSSEVTSADSEVYFDVKKVNVAGTDAEGKPTTIETDKLTGTVYMGAAKTPTEGHKLAGVSGNTLYTTDIDLSTVLTTGNVLDSTDIDKIITSAESLLVLNNDTPVWAGGEVKDEGGNTSGYDPYTKYPKA